MNERLNQVSRDSNCEHGITFLQGNGFVRCGTFGEVVGVDIIETLKNQVQKDFSYSNYE